MAWREEENYLEKAHKEGVYKNTFPESWLSMNFHDRNLFSKFTYELYNEVKDSHSLRHIVLVTSLALEGFMDFLLKQIFKTKDYSLYNSKELFSEINFKDKLKIIDFFKTKYNQSKPVHLRRNFTIQTSGRFWKKLQENASTEWPIIEEILLKTEKNLQEENWEIASTEVVNVWEDDYLDDALILILNKIDIKKFRKVNDRRNIVSHDREIKEKFQLEEEKVLTILRETLDINL